MPTKQEIQIEKVIFGGAGLGRLEGKVCLVPDVIAGETVHARVRQEKKAYAKAKLIKILKASPERVTPPCSYVKQCGGCQYQHMTYREQLRTKEVQVREAVTHDLRLNPERVASIVGSPKDYHYRNHVTLHPLTEAAEAQRLGYIGRDKKTGVLVEDCVISDQRLKPIFNSEIPLESARKRVTFWLNEKGEILSDLYPAFFRVKVLGKSLVTHSQGFFQNNLRLTELIVQQIKKKVDHVKPKSFIDLYAGSGLFSLLAAEEVQNLVCMEENLNSLQALRENFMHEGSKKLEILEGKVEKTFPEFWSASKTNVRITGPGPAVVFLDPPRTGVDLSLANYLAGQDIPHLVYLACDLPILVRDLKIILSREKYEVEKIIPYDMFPQTKHIEVLALLKGIPS